MAIRKIRNAERTLRSTFVILDCGHKRSFGGHMYQDRVYLPSDLIGMTYDCQEEGCRYSKS